MKEYKLNWKFWFSLLFFCGVLVLGIKVIVMLLKNEVAYYDEQMSPIFSYVLALALSMPLLSYLISVISLIKLTLTNNGCGLTLSYRGIENTVVFINLFAFVFVIPVKLIPWETVKYYDYDDEPYIRVETRFIQASFLAKITIKIIGYNFCDGFVKPKVSNEDIQKFSCGFAEM